ncbi:MAG: cytochrome ubiquinol oxidase subunit I, partial [TACK group archaeon]|nr:cytochrome ubiquinol oxidase subunit I [TACK group archaeon]
MTSVWIGFLMLGVTIVAHIFLVSLVLGLAVMAPIIEYWAYRTGDKELEAVAKDTLKYMAVSELAAGVWATWFTVALAGFWPQLTFIATDVLFYPLTIALFGVMLGIPLMAVYWYTWDTVSKKLHIAIGSFMALGAMLVPTGFNMIFAFLDDPVGMAGALHGNGWAVFANPLYPDFTFHRITAAISMVALAISAIYSLKASTGEEHYLKASKFGLYVGLPALLLASISGAAYALELDKYSPYVASSVLGPLSATSLSTYFHLYPAFVGFMGIVTLIWAASIF